MAFDQEVLDNLKFVYDPEIRVNIVDLGLVYSVKKKDQNTADIKMTLTSPGCPVSEQIVRDVKFAASKHPEVDDVEVEIVWEPQWNKDMMTEEAKLILGF